MVRFLRFLREASGLLVKGLWLTITDATFVVTRCKYTIKIHFLTLFLVTNSFCFISFLLICFNMWVNVAFSTKKSAASRDAAPSKYQNNVSNTNYYNSFVKHPI